MPSKQEARLLLLAALIDSFFCKSHTVYDVQRWLVDAQ